MKNPIDLTAERDRRGGTSNMLLDSARRAIQHRDFAEAERGLRAAERIERTPESAALNLLLEQAQIEHAAEMGIDPLMRPEQVFAVVGLGRAAIWQRVTNGSFPAPVSLGKHRIAWRASAVRQWLAERPTVAYAPTAA